MKEAARKSGWNIYPKNFNDDDDDVPFPGLRTMFVFMGRGCNKFL